MRYLPFIFLVLVGCLETYDPTIEFRPTDVIVIDGFVNATDKTATVKLSRPQAMDNKDAFPEITGAVVSVSSPSAKFDLTETSPGTYSLTNVPVTIGEEYTLHVEIDDREFYSDAMPALATPPLDSITFDMSNDQKGLEVMVNAHDPSNEAKYFSWDYVETYEYTSPFLSGFVWDAKNPRARRDDEQIFRCWRTAPSSSIGIVTTKDLSGSVISKFPIIHIPGGSLKVSNRYSVLVKQRVIGLAEYTYLGILKKTTENLGGLFDAQPGTVRGNIHEVGKSNNIVIGFFGASEVAQKRVFIRYTELPEGLQIRPPVKCKYEYTCQLYPNVRRIGCTPLEIIGVNYEVLTGLVDATGFIYQYTYSEKDCADCRRQGGVTKKPDFW